MFFWFFLKKVYSADSAKKCLFSPHMKKIKSSANRWNVSCPGGGYLVRIHKGKHYRLVSEMRTKV